MSKFFLLSKTIVGLIIASLPTLLPALGIDFSSDDQTMISQTWDSIITAGGLILGVIGRFSATQAVRLKP